MKAMAERPIAKIKSGELQPFKGPITKQDGTLGVEDGKSHRRRARCSA